MVPLQKPHPPIWVPSQGSSETIRWAADPARKYPFLVTFSAEELPNFDGTTYVSDTFPDVLLRSRYAPVVDKISITPMARPR